MSGRDGFETVFGAILLIMICFICASYLISITNSESMENLTYTTDIDERMEYILESSIVINLEEGNRTSMRIMSIEDYVMICCVGNLLDENPNKPISDDLQEQIGSIIDFFIPFSNQWLFYVEDSFDNKISLAEHVEDDITENESIISQKKIYYPDGKKLIIGLRIIN